MNDLSARSFTFLSYLQGLRTHEDGKSQVKKTDPLKKTNKIQICFVVELVKKRASVRQEKQNNIL